MAKLNEYLHHRDERERQVLDALGAESRTIDELVPEIYAGYRRELLELAARSVLAHLLKLEAEGRVERRTALGQERWRTVEPKACERCGRPVRGRAKFCGPCSLAVLQEPD
jgi:hypothetical protein